MKLSTVSAFKNINASTVGLHELTDEEEHALQKTLFDMMIDIDCFCRDNKISYSLGGGSLLGAVRHGGFIPWDDDVDLNFPRADYERFRRLFPQMMGDRYWLHTPEETHEYGLCMARVRKKGTVVRSREDIDNDECGAYADIFIVENVSGNRFERLFHGILSMAAGFLLSCRVFYKNRGFYRKIGDSDTKLSGVFKCKIIIGGILSVFGVDVWTHFWNNINKAYTNGKSEYVSIPVGVKHFFGETYLRSKVCETEDIPFTFDGRTELFRAMKDTDYYLTKRYGDWRTPPQWHEIEKHIVLEFKLD